MYGYATDIAAKLRTERPQIDGGPKVRICRREVLRLIASRVFRLERDAVYHRLKTRVIAGSFYRLRVCSLYS